MNQTIDYVGVEAYPVSVEEVVLMNYVAELNAENERPFSKKCMNAIGKKKLF